MSQVGWLPIDLRALDDAPSQLLVLAAFSDERPLERLTGLVDWRLCGALSSWRLGGFSTGELGERVLCPSHGRLAQDAVLLMGLGPRAHFRSDRALAIAGAALEVAHGLGRTELTATLLGLEALAAPLERTGPKLVHLLRTSGHLSRVTLVADEASQRMIKEGIQFFGR